MREIFISDCEYLRPLRGYGDPRQHSPGSRGEYIAATARSVCLAGNNCVNLVSLGERCCAVGLVVVDEAVTKGQRTFEGSG